MTLRQVKKQRRFSFWKVMHLKCLLDIQVDLLSLIDKSQA